MVPVGDYKNNVGPNEKTVSQALFRGSHPLGCVCMWQGSIVLCHYSWSQTVCSNFQEMVSAKGGFQIQEEAFPLSLKMEL